MKLYEHETKELLKSYGVRVPDKKGERYVVKAQVLAKNRKKHGGIEFADSLKDAEDKASEMKGKEVNNHEVKDVLVEERVKHSKEYYVSFVYDTDVRSPVIIFSKEGGTGVENREIHKTVLKDLESWKLRQFLKEIGICSEELNPLTKTLYNMLKCFFEEDARMLEANPLAKTEKGFTVLDASIELDEDAAYRHERNYAERTGFGREKTEREKQVQKIDEEDHRGIAGKYTELNGDIGMMLAGGGASLTNMDALIQYGGRPANYMEYGGNPPTEKLYKLSKIVLSKPGLKGLWHVGGTANNTDIYRTMKGFCQALEEIKPKYPIVVRRDGPNADKAFKLLEETKEKHNLNMKLYRNDTTMTETAKTLMEMIENE